MKRRVFLQSSLGLGALGGLGPAGAAMPATAPLQWRERSLVGFGTVLSLRVAHAKAAQADQALDAAVRVVRHVEDQMSLFNPDSAVSRLNRDGVLRDPHPDLLQVFQLAQGISARSSGAFDVTVQPLWTVFEAAQRRGTLPSATAVAQARAAVGWRRLRVSPQEIRLGGPGMAVTLNGIAQGFAADLVRSGLESRGIRHALINTGEWSALGRPEPDRPWLLGIADPHEAQALLGRLAMDGRSVATSSDSETFFSADHRHHHVFDPRTGYSPTGLSSVTVAAPSCALADALTKVMLNAGRQEALRLAREWQVDVLVVDKAGRWEASEGLKLQKA
ncbi:FAD:protein FMN transferase [Azohydromonas lata]|uniref:FAD:protein FMN transferase n=1 Tax=Azohydromonas lata TaxID=45677 RepID=UPI00082B3120|nr:FAD:protein FMN transferase [Azohydromonas lata]